MITRSGKGISKACIFGLFFDFLTRKRIPYVIVGDTRDYPQHIESDVDVVVSRRDFASLEKVVCDFCDAHDVQLVQLLQHEQTAKYFVLAWFDESGGACFLHLDICSDYYRNGKLLLSADELLREAGSTNGFSIPAPSREFIYYLLKKVDKRALDQRCVEHLCLEHAKDSAGAATAMSSFWPTESVEGIAGALGNGDSTALAGMLPQLREELHKRISSSFFAYARDFLRKGRRGFFPTGVCVAFLGPDGAGKSTVIAQVEQDLAVAFRKTKVFHLFPRSRSGKGAAAAVTDPHAKRARGVLPSVAKLCLFFARYTLGYWCIVRPLLVRSTFVLFDRYYHDLLVDQKRYRYGGPAWVARLVGRTIPHPDLWIVLDAPAEVLQARKQEVSLQETARQVAVYRALARDLRGGTVVDVSQPVEQVVAEVNRHVLRFMAKRSALRYRAGDGRCATD